VILKKKAIQDFETAVALYQSSQRNIAEDINLAVHNAHEKKIAWCDAVTVILRNAVFRSDALWIGSYVIFTDVSQ
jgi:hypothetical protein